MLQRGVTEAHWRWDQQISPTVVIKKPAEGSNLGSHLMREPSCVCERESEREREGEKRREEGWSVDHREQYTKGI